MSDELVELDFCCPECHCSQWQHVDDGVYACGRCDYFVTFTQDEPSSDDSPICPKCKSADIALDSVFGYYKCSSCFAAWVDDADDPDQLFKCFDCGNRLLTWIQNGRPYCQRCDTGLRRCRNE